MLANLLGAIGMSGPAVYRTGLTDVYDFTLSWDNEAGPALSTALHQQLGLQMKTEKVAVSKFVVDGAENRPRTEGTLRQTVVKSVRQLAA